MRRAVSEWNTILDEAVALQENHLIVGMASFQYSSSFAKVISKYQHIFTNIKEVLIN